MERSLLEKAKRALNFDDLPCSKQPKIEPPVGKSVTRVGQFGLGEIQCPKPKLPVPIGVKEEDLKKVTRVLNFDDMYKMDPLYKPPVVGDQLLKAVPEVGENFQILKEIGQGTFSRVYLSRLRNHEGVKQRFAIKHILPTSHPERLEMELKIMQTIGGQKNVMGSMIAMRKRDSLAIVMPYYPHDKFKDIVKNPSEEEVRQFMFHLLTALAHLHSHSIIHRDVKPSNYLANVQSGRYALSDFGLAQKVEIKKVKDKSVTVAKRSLAKSWGQVKENVVCSPKKRLCADKSQDKHQTSRGKLDDSQYAVPALSKQNLKKPLITRRSINTSRHPSLTTSSTSLSARTMLDSTHATPFIRCGCLNKATVCEVCTSKPNERAPRSGTPGFRAPEVLLHSKEQTTAIDMWAAGVILLSLLSGKYPFFTTHDDVTSLAQIIDIKGSDAIKDLAQKLGKTLVCEPERHASSLKDLCLRFRKYRVTSFPPSHNGTFSDDAYLLLEGLLEADPNVRLSAEAALKMDFFA